MRLPATFDGVIVLLNGDASGSDVVLDAVDDVGEEVRHRRGQHGRRAQLVRERDVLIFGISRLYKPKKFSLFGQVTWSAEDLEYSFTTALWLTSPFSSFS